MSDWKIPVVREPGFVTIPARMLLEEHDTIEVVMQVRLPRNHATCRQWVTKIDARHGVALTHVLKGMTRMVLDELQGGDLV